MYRLEYAELSAWLLCSSTRKSERHRHLLAFPRYHMVSSTSFSTKASALVVWIAAFIAMFVAPSQAQVTFTSALRSVGVSAINNGVPDEQIQSTTLGDFDETLIRSPVDGLGNVGRLLASQQSRILSHRVELSLTADTSQPNSYTVASRSLAASARFVTTFVLTAPTEYVATFDILTNSSLGGSAVLGLSRLDGGTEVSIFSANHTDPPSSPLVGILQPGEYAFGGSAIADSRSAGFGGLVGVARAVASFVIPGPTTILSVGAMAAMAAVRPRRTAAA